MLLTARPGSRLFHIRNDEVRAPYGHAIIPPDYPARNPAFDVTPHRYVTAIVTERGVARAPYTESLRALAAV